MFNKKIVLSIAFAITTFLITQTRLAAGKEARLMIVATTPDLADVTRRVGGDHVTVETLAKGTEDLHAVPQRPSFIPKLARAKGLVHLGLGAEHTFLPALVEASANPDILPTHVGDIDCSAYVTPLQVPASLSRALGELHPDGNPHYNIDPRKGFLISKAIAEGIARIDPANSASYEKNRAAFDKELQEKMPAWTKQAAHLKNMKAVSYHRDMIYLGDFLGLNLIGEIEPQPGIAPSPKHLETLAARMKNENVRLILLEVQYDDKAAVWLADKTGARLARVAAMGNAFPDTSTYIGMIDHNITAITQAAQP